MSVPAAGAPASARRRVASSTAVQLAGKGVGLAVGAVSIVILTRYLGPEGYGRYALALAYMQLFGVLADLGLYTIVVRELSKDASRTDELVGNTLTLRLALALAVIALGAGVSLLLPYPPSVRTAIALAGAPVLFGMLTSAIVAVLQAQVRMTRAVVADIVGRFVAFGLAVAAAALDLGFYVVVAAAGVGAAATLVVTAALTRPIVRLRPRRDLRLWRTLLTASLPLGLALAINAIYFRIDTVIISLYEPAAQVGFYTLAYRILEITLIVGTIYLSTTFPVLADAITHDPGRARRVVQTSSDLLLVLGVPLAAGGLVLAPELVAAVDPRFADAATPLRLLFVAGALAWLNGVFGYALIAKNRQASALWLNVVALTFNVGLNFLLVPRYGIVVAAAVTAASEVVILAGSYWLMRRYLGFFPSLLIVLPAAAAATAMGGLLALGRTVPVAPAVTVAVLVPLGLAVYAALMWTISPASRALVAGIRR